MNILRILSNPVGAAAYGATFERAHSDALKWGGTIIKGARKKAYANGYSAGSKNVMRAVGDWIENGTGTITAGSSKTSSAIFLAEAPRPNLQPKWEFFGGAKGAVEWLEQHNIYGVNDGNGRFSVLRAIEGGEEAPSHILAVPLVDTGNAVIEVPRIVKGEPSDTDYKFVTTGRGLGFMTRGADAEEMMNAAASFASKLAKLKK